MPRRKSREEKDEPGAVRGAAFEVECGYLLRALSPDFAVRCLRGSWRGFSENEIPAGFPHSSEELSSYRAVVLSDVGSEHFDAQAQTALGEYVHAGGGFLMIGGHASFGGFEKMGNWGDTPVEELLPVQIVAGHDVVQHHRGFFFEVENGEHAAVAGIDFSEMPVAIGYNRVRARPDAQVVLTCGDDPVLCTRQVGRGRTAAYTSDAHPHWSGGWTDWPHYSAFWRSVLRWVCGAE